MSLRDAVRSFREIPIQLIDDPLVPSRAQMDEEKLEELVTDIRAKGVLQPIVVVQRADRYEVKAGHRRTIAARRVGLPVLPCVVYPSDEAALEGVKFSENRFREDLNPADEAIWFHELLERECGGDIERLCAMLGAKLSYVDNRLALFQGDPVVFEALQAGKIKIGVAHELNKCPDPEYRRFYLDCAMRTDATVATVSAWLIEWKNIFGSPRPASPVAPAAPSVLPVSAHDPHRCYICGKNDPRFIPEQIAVHTHCRLALLDPMLDSARGEAVPAAPDGDPRRP